MTTSGDKILAGKYNSSEKLDSTTKLLIQNLQRKCGTIPNNEISEDNLRTAFRKWKETTSSSPSGRHLGHMRTLTTKLTDKDKREWPENTALPSEIFHIIYQLIIISHEQVHPLPRWLTCYNLLIQKIIDNMKIHKQ